MANQPPSRPWFRVPVLGRQAPAPAPPPAAQPQPRPPFVRPAFAQPQPRAPPPPPQQPRPAFARPSFPQSFRPTQPQLQSNTTTTPRRPAASPSPTPFPVVSPSPSPSVASPHTPAMTSPKTSPTSSSPRKPPMQSSASPTKPQVSAISPASTFPPKSSSFPSVSFAHSPTPTASPTPKIIRSPPPISLPPQSNPSKEEPEPETNKVLFHNNTSSKYGSVKEADRRRMLPSNSEDGGNLKVLTIAGENKGATLELGFISKSAKQGYGSGNGNAGDEGGEADWSDHEGMMMTTTQQPKKAIVNSNTQAVNSSILIDCSLTQHDPGVHFLVLRKPINGNGNGNGNAK